MFWFLAFARGRTEWCATSKEIFKGFSSGFWGWFVLVMVLSYVTVYWHVGLEGYEVLIDGLRDFLASVPF